MLKTGCDIVKINRMQRFCEHPERLGKILTPGELALYERRQDKTQFLAGRWAAKEAVAKMLGGIVCCPPDGVEVLPDETGAPQVRLLGETALKYPGLNIQVSISHDGEYAIATAIAHKEEQL